MNPSFVLDCSVTMAWCFEDESSPYAEAVLLSLERAKALVPSFWTLEVANVLLIAERKKRLREAEMFHFTQLLSQLPIQVGEAHFSMTDFILLGQKHELTSYDACYFGLALVYGLPLATLDKKLKHTATKAGILLYAP